jgi:hypothetical protein
MAKHRTHRQTDRPAIGGSPDQQVSLTDPDARAMATGSDHRGVVSYNV